MATATGFERLAQALDAMRDAIPRLTYVDGAITLSVSDPELRREVEAQTVLLTEILAELRALNSERSAA